MLISTFARNKEQQLIDLGEFRFITFVDTGRHMPFNEPNHTQIFFLVSPPKRNTVRLMCYRAFVWPKHPSNQELKTKKDGLRIVSGEIDLTVHLGKQFTIDKIVKATVLHRKSN